MNENPKSEAPVREPREGESTHRPTVPPRSAMSCQQGGFAGAFASPGLCVDDAPSEISGLDEDQKRR